MSAPESPGLRERCSAYAGYLRATWLALFGARIGPRASVGPRCDLRQPKAIALGARSVLEAGVSIKLIGGNAAFESGEHVFVGRGCIFDLVGPFGIGAGTLIAPGCFITDHNHGTSALEPMWKQPVEHKPVSIGADVWLGAGVVILPGVTVGDGAVVAAGAVVTANVEPMTIVGGVPARVLRRRD